jgi:hypothetical protein
VLIDVNAQKGKHPSIMLTKDNVAAVQNGVTKYPLLKKSFQKMAAVVLHMSNTNATTNIYLQVVLHINLQKIKSTLST